MKIAILNILTVIIPGTIIFTIPETLKTEIPFVITGHLLFQAITSTLVKRYILHNSKVIKLCTTPSAVKGMSKVVNNHIP